MSTDHELRISLVCTGNTCRSPMSEGILQAEVERLGLAWRVDSGGLSAYPGVPATEGALIAAREGGVDLRSHRSSLFTPERARARDLILVHSGEHYHHIATWGDDVEVRTFLLKHFPESGDPGPKCWVADPMGQELDAYLNTWRELKQEIQRVVPAIQRWVKERYG